MFPEALPDLNNVRRLLIIRLSSIGDVVHAIPISAALAEGFPRLEITWLVEEMSAPIVLDNPYLHEVIVIPRSRWKRARARSPRIWLEFAAFARDLRRRDFDVSLDLHGHAKSGLMAFLAGAPHRLGWSNLRDGASLASKALPRREKSFHRVDQFLDVAWHLGAPTEPVRFPIVIPDDAHKEADSLLSRVGIDSRRPYAVLNPATGDLARRWGERPFGRLACRLASEWGIPSVLIGSSKDSAACEAVINYARGDAPVGASLPANLAGATGLKVLAAVIEKCCVHVCGDTGSAHIAAALGRPVVGIYGPTDPEHAGPWGQGANVLSGRDHCSSDCPVRYCSARSANRLPAARDLADRSSGAIDAPEAGVAMAPCLRSISVDDVLSKVGSILHG